MPTTNVSETIDFNGQQFFIGLDVHKKSWSVTVRSLNHQVAHFTQPPCAKALYKTLQTKFAGGKFYSAYEAGFCGTGYHEQLCKVGITNIIVHAADIPQTDKQKKNKTDLHDSLRAYFKFSQAETCNGLKSVGTICYRADGSCRFRSQP